MIVKCQQCHKGMRLPNGVHKVRCPHCSAIVTAPESPPAEISEAAPVAPKSATTPSAKLPTSQPATPTPAVSKPATPRKTLDTRPAENNSQPGRLRRQALVLTGLAIILIASAAIFWVIARRGEHAGEVDVAEVKQPAFKQAEVEQPVEKQPETKHSAAQQIAPKQPENKNSKGKGRHNEIVAQLKRLGAVRPSETKVGLDYFLLKVYASAGDENAAFERQKPRNIYEHAQLLASVQHAQIRHGELAKAKATAAKIQALLQESLASNGLDKPGKDQGGMTLADVVRLTAAAWARVGDVEAVGKVIAGTDKVTATGAVWNAVDILGKNVDAMPIFKAFDLITREQRLSMLSNLVDLQGEIAQPQGVDFYSRLWQEFEEQPDDRLLSSMRTRVLIGMCRHGGVEQAAKLALAMNTNDSCRWGWLAAIARLEIGAGKTDAAIDLARRGGYLALTAELQINAGRVVEAVKTLRTELLALEEIPADVITPERRVRLLRQIALLQFAAQVPAEARHTLKLARMWIDKVGAGSQKFLRAKLEESESDAARATAKKVDVFMVPSYVNPDDTLGDAAVDLVKKRDVKGALAQLTSLASYTQRHATQLARVAAAQAEQGDIPAAFATFFDNVRSVGEDNVPTRLLVHASVKGHFDLVLRYLNTSETHLLRQLLAELKGPEAEAQAEQILEHALERTLARDRFDTNKYQLLELLDLIAEKAGPQRLAQIVPLLTNTGVPPGDFVALLAKHGLVDVIIEFVQKPQQAGPQLVPFLLDKAMEVIALQVVPREDLEPHLRRNPPERPRAPKDHFTLAFEATLPGVLILNPHPEAPTEPFVESMAFERLSARSEKPLTGVGTKIPSNP